MTEKPSTKLYGPDDLKRLKFEATRAERLTQLHSRFRPHTGQVTAGKQIFAFNRKFVMIQCGRSWGKSYFGVYAAVRAALERGNQKIYIVFPERGQAAEVIWESGYLHEMIPIRYLHAQSVSKAYNKSDLRVRLDNNSFVRLLGSDNPDSLRGMKPHLVIFDEFRDFKSDAYDIMEPNLGINNATLMICSTPPDREGNYTELMELFKYEMDHGNSEYFFMQLPTDTNPYFPTKRLEATKRQLIRRGEYSTWRREYLAEFVPGGANAVFPGFGKNKRNICREPEFLEIMLQRDKKKLDWYCLFDPAINSTFGVLFAAINRHSGQVFILDEIYERDREKIHASQMWKRAREIKQRHFPHPERWINVYDEAAAFFEHHLSQYGEIEEWESLEPTQKSTRDKDMDISILKELFAVRGRIFISRACEGLIFEVENYVTDQKGDYIKKDDHQVDNLRYLLSASQFEPNEFPDPDTEREPDDRLIGKALSFQQLFQERDDEANAMSGELDQVYGDDDVVLLDEINSEWWH